MLEVPTIKFLKDLRKNNNKPWFDANRSRYEAAKKDFEQFIGTLIDKHSKKDPGLLDLKPKDCIFRINRDIRFSKDKSPYKTNFGASMNRGGKKSIFAGYYFHCDPGQSFVGGGLWMPQPVEMKKVRQEIDYCFDEFGKIIGSARFKRVYGSLYEGEDMRLVKVPQGFEKDSPAAAYIKLKSWIAMQPVKDADLTSKNLVKQSLAAFEALQPLVAFINRAME